MLLSEARTTLTQSVLHVGNTSFDMDELDRAMRRAGHQLLRETGLVRSKHIATLASGSETIDFSAAAGFSPGLIVMVYIRDATSADDWFRLEVRDLGDVVELHNRTGSSGRPEVIAWQTSGDGLVFPRASQDYDIQVVYKATFTSWTPGDMGAYSATTIYQTGMVVSSSSNVYRSRIEQNLNKTPASNPDEWMLIGAASAYPIVGPSAINLNIPDRYVDDWLHTGVKWALLSGAAGHEDGPAARADWHDFIKQVKGEAWPSGVRIPGRNRHLRGTYQSGLRSF